MNNIKKLNLVPDERQKMSSSSGSWYCTTDDKDICYLGKNFFAKFSKVKEIIKNSKLKDYIEKIREDYKKKLQDSKSAINKQLGTATYLIDRLALRVGNEKSEDEADTVGCCSLRVEHIKMEEDSQITLDFLGLLYFFKKTMKIF